MEYFIIFGAPGAGKGTQSKLIAERYNLKHISTGDLLRQEIADNSELGMLAKAVIEKGNLVDDKIVLSMIEHEFDTEEEKNRYRGFLLDGYPRNLTQAEDLEKVLQKAKHSITGVIALEIDDETIMSRIKKRALLENRKDDANETIIKNRIVTYHRQTSPLIAHYKSLDLYYPVCGEGTIEQNFADICKIVDRLLNKDRDNN